MTSTATAGLGVRPSLRDTPAVRSSHRHLVSRTPTRGSTRVKAAEGEHAIAVPLPTSGDLAPPPWVRDAVDEWPWRGGLEPCGEHVVARLPDDAVVGKVPPDLIGSLYRVGPGRCRVGSTKYAHWFDGDGAVFKCGFNADGSVDAGFRMVRTARLETQERAEREKNSKDTGIAVRGAWTQVNQETFPFANFGKFPTNPSNTAPMFFDGKLLALCEGGAPVEVCENTLATKGVVRFESEGNKSEKMPMGFSAHCKKDADGTLYTWGLSSPPAVGMRVAKLSKTGQVQKAVDLPLGNTRDDPAVKYEFTLIHDCAMSEKHLVFVVPPWRLKPGFDGKLVKALAVVESFGHSFSWDSGKGAWVVVLRKSDLSVVVAQETKNMSTYHFAGAYDVAGDDANGDGNSIRVLVNELIGTRVDLEKRFGDMYNSVWGDDGYNILCEYVVDLKSGELVKDNPVVPAAASRRASGKTRRENTEIKNKTRGQLPMEFPAVAPCSFGRSPEFIYTLCFSGSGGGYFDAIQKLEVGKETHATRFLPPGVFPSEVEFVPRRTNGEKNAEDDGYLLYLEYDSAAHRSSVVVLDAMDVAGPQLCRVNLPYHVPYSFHGTYKQVSE